MRCNAAQTAAHGDVLRIDGRVEFPTVPSAAVIPESTEQLSICGSKDLQSCVGARARSVDAQAAFGGVVFSAGNPNSVAGRSVRVDGQRCRARHAVERGADGHAVCCCGNGCGGVQDKRLCLVQLNLARHVLGLQGIDPQSLLLCETIRLNRC